MPRAEDEGPQASGYPLQLPQEPFGSGLGHQGHMPGGLGNCLQVVGIDLGASEPAVCHPAIKGCHLSFLLILRTSFILEASCKSVSGVHLNAN